MTRDEQRVKLAQVILRAVLEQNYMDDVPADFVGTSVAYLDQGEVDFLLVADAALDVFESAGMVVVSVAALREARAKALEEAAKVLDVAIERNAKQRDEEDPDSEDWAVLNRGVFVLSNAAAAIRALAQKE